MSVLGDLDARTFLREHWQHQPLIVRATTLHESVDIDAQALLELGCEEDVESRLVVHEPTARRWSCEHGPFDRGRFESLPDGHWTLLVQALDQWLPEFSALKDHFDFLPRWRLDDIMVSLAAPGGGVGPHFDRYDVFLLQLSGERRWQIGQHCDDSSALEDNAELKLLAHFEERQSAVLGPGDMLYLPPGIAHWGTATNGDCITCSIGFRAPSHAEIFQDAASRLHEELLESDRYGDRGRSPPSDPYLIDRDIENALLSRWQRLEPATLKRVLSRAMGSLVTEPRYPDAGGFVEDDCDGEPAAVVELECPLALEQSPSSRFAYSLNGDAATLFVDGDVIETSARFARGVCHGCIEQATDDELELLLELMRQGVLRRRP